MKTRMKSGERRAAIVGAAIRLFAEKGFRGTTTRELASAVGVTEPVLYQHFRDKRELYNAIVEARGADFTEDARELEKLAHGGHDRAFFLRLGRLILARFESHPEMVRLLLFSSLERHEVSELFFERISAGFQKLVAGYIRGRIRAGAFRPANAEVAARSFIGMISYQGLSRLLLPRLAKPGRRVVEEMTELFLEGILRQRPEEPKPPVPRRDSARSPSTHSTAS